MTILDYLDSLNKNNSFYDFYNKIISFENVHFIPSIRFEVGLFLYNILYFKKPQSILEIGFGSGASTFFIYKALIDLRLENTLFISLERDKNRFNRGKKLIENYKYTNIRLFNMDAFDFLKENKNSFDFIFLDAVKRDYIIYLDKLKNILNKDGILICDNILFNGKVIDDNLEDKYKNGVALLKEFNNALSQDKNFNTTFLNIGDGISFSVKLGGA